MAELERFGVSMDGELLEAFDQRIQQAGYANRSEAIRDIVRDYLVAQEIQSPSAPVIGTVTIVYDHHARQLGDRLTDLQHDHHDAIRCSTHVHLDAHNCVEVIVLSGASALVKEIAENLISTRGVKHGKLVLTTPQHGHH
jgi:CopG family transcriptional regulator, nickel-responsive regulator